MAAPCLRNLDRASLVTRSSAPIQPRQNAARVSAADNSCATLTCALVTHGPAPKAFVITSQAGSVFQRHRCFELPLTVSRQVLLRSFLQIAGTTSRTRRTDSKGS